MTSLGRSVRFTFALLTRPLEILLELQSVFLPELESASLSHSRWGITICFPGILVARTIGSPTLRSPVTGNAATSLRIESARR